MGFINDDQIRSGYSPPSQGLDGADLNRLRVVGHFVLALHHADLKDPVLSEPLYRLVDQAQRRNAEQHPLVLGPRHIDDRSRYDGLA
jgi:hypothetical protein